MSGCFGRWRGTRRSGRCKLVGQGWEALSAWSHRAPLTALGFASTWRRKLATPALREGVASDIRRHRHGRSLWLSKSGNPTTLGSRSESLPALNLKGTPAERENGKIRFGGQAAGPFHCSRNARPQKALVGRAQFGPALLPARGTTPAPGEGESRREKPRSPRQSSPRPKDQTSH
jgi:hypothetical protein